MKIAFALASLVLSTAAYAQNLSPRAPSGAFAVQQEGVWLITVTPAPLADVNVYPQRLSTRQCFGGSGFENPAQCAQVATFGFDLNDSRGDILKLITTDGVTFSAMYFSRGRAVQCTRCPSTGVRGLRSVLRDAA